MAATLDDRTLLPPDESARVDLLKALKHLRPVPDFGAGTRVIHSGLVGPGGEVLDLPAEVYRILRTIVEEMAHGRAVIVQTTDPVLTTGQAADILKVSRVTVARLIDEGRIPAHMRGTHRRVLLADVLAYDERMRRDRAKALAEMSLEAAESGLDEETDSLPAGEE
jgi:excisionase family DNA binding protein